MGGIVEVEVSPFIVRLVRKALMAMALSALPGTPGAVVEAAGGWGHRDVRVHLHVDRPGAGEKVVPVVIPSSP
jgi:hypothetical protein